MMRKWLVETAKMAPPGGCKFYLESTCAQPHRVWVLSSSQQAGSWTAEHTRLFPSSCQQAHVPRSPATDWVRGEDSVTADHALLRSCLAPAGSTGPHPSSPAPFAELGHQRGTPSVLGIDQPQCKWQRNLLLVMLRVVSDSLSRWKCTQHLELAVSTQANVYGNQVTRKHPADFFFPCSNWP